jgi:hypothetical protein
VQGSDSALALRCLSITITDDNAVLDGADFSEPAQEDTIPPFKLLEHPKGLKDLRSKGK